MNATLDLRRLGLLIRSDSIAEYRTLLIACAALAALMLIGSMTNLARFDPGTDYYYLGWYQGILAIGGSIVASFSFRELHDKTRNEAYLLLPATALEKTLARLLYATVGFFAFLLIFLTLTSAVIEGINWALFGRHHDVFNPSLGAVWMSAGLFLPISALFFLGAAWFRRAHYIKTVLTLAATPIVLAIVGAIIGRFLFREPLFGLSGEDFEGYYRAHEPVFDALLLALKVVYFVVLPVFCWFVAWLRVTETQASDGV